jgi:hypothetical protein
MIFGRQASRVLVYESPVDMRKSFDGLQAVASWSRSRHLLGAHQAQVYRIRGL